MSSKKASQSPRVKAHSLKATSSSKKLKKKSSSRALVDTLESVTSVEEYEPMVSSPRGMDRSITSLAEEKSLGQVMKTMTGQDVLQLQMELAKAMDNTSILRSRFRAELEHRQVLESKITDLTEKLSEARRGLAETKGALNKVQTVASQLITKRDEREVQLQQALDQNGIYERKIAELEMHISHLSHINEQNSNSNMEKTIQAFVEKEKMLNEMVSEMKEKLATLRKELIHVQEEKENVEYVLEAKKKRITTLEEQVSRLSEGGLTSETLASTRDSLLMSMLDMTRAQTATNAAAANGTVTAGSSATGGLGSPMNPRASMVNGSSIAEAIAAAVVAANSAAATPSADVQQFESKINTLESDKKGLEDRLLQLEKQLIEQQKMQMQQQQMQMAQQQKMQQQMQMQMQMAQQQAMMAAVSGVGPAPGSATPLMRNSNSRASNLRISSNNGAMTPTHSNTMNASGANLMDMAAQVVGNTVVSPTAAAAAAAAMSNNNNNVNNGFATPANVVPITNSAPVNTNSTMPTNMNNNVPVNNSTPANNMNNTSNSNINSTNNFTMNNSNTNDHTLNNNNNVNVNNNANFTNMNSMNNNMTMNNNNPIYSNNNMTMTNNSNNANNNYSNAAASTLNTVSNTSAVPQQALAEAEAQAVLREILSSRERTRPKTVERPRSNDGVHVSSNNNTNTNNSSHNNANNPRQSSRASMDRSQRGGNSRASSRAGGTNLPVQTNTPTFNNNNTTNNTDAFGKALEQTQRVFAEGNNNNAAANNKPFETSVRDASSASAQVRPTMSRLASRFIRAGEDPEQAKLRLTEEKRVQKKKITDWIKKYQQENEGRDPPRAEREAACGGWYKEYRQISKVLKEMEDGPGAATNSRASMSMPDMDD